MAQDQTRSRSMAPWVALLACGAALLPNPVGADVAQSCELGTPGVCTFRCEAGDYVLLEGDGVAPIGQVRCGSAATMTCEGLASFRFSCFLGPRPASDSAGDCRALGGNTWTRCTAAPALP